MEAVTGAFVLAGVAVSFGVSASAGLGGSLVLVPTLALVLGAKEGIALAALLPAGNNVVKIVAYRDSLPFRKAAWIVAGIGAGAIFGAGLLVAVPEDVVALAVIASFSLAIRSNASRQSRGPARHTRPYYRLRREPPRASPELLAR